jgi:hypothetical protein
MTKKYKYDFHELRTLNNLEYNRRIRRLQGIKPLIKYSFHKLRTENSKEYERLIYLTNPEVREKAILSNNHYRHRIWKAKNCSICGKFCPRRSQKYCSFCRGMMDEFSVKIWQYQYD